MKATKICSRCGEEKPLGSFGSGRGADGRCGYCKDCARDGYPETMKKRFGKLRRREADYLEERFGKDRVDDIVVELRERGYRGSFMQMAVQLYVCETGMKRCPTCKEYKPVGEFAKGGRTFDGLKRCKECNREKKKEAYREKNRRPKETSAKMAAIKELADKCRELRIRKILNGC